MKIKIKFKYILLGIVTIVSLCVTVYIVALSVQAGFDYVTELIILEQNDHYNKMQKNIIRLDGAVGALQGDVDNLQKKQLTQEEKKLMTKELRDLEEIGLNISRETGFYQEDTTVHFFFEPEEEIIEYFNRTRNTPLFIDRFVRAIEQGLFEDYMTQKQKRMIMENYKLLRTEIKNVQR